MPGERHPPFDELYRQGTQPWDIGRPQPELVRLAGEGGFVGDVLDVGCGTGENALHLAGLGRPVVGVDLSPFAVEQARAKAAQRGIAADFLVADALDLASIRRRFETVLDCGLFHVFAPEDRRRYAHSLCEVLSPGSTLQLLCFSDAEPPGLGPHRIAEADLREAFRSLLVLSRIRPGRLESLVHPGGARAWVATLTRI